MKTAQSPLVELLTRRKFGRTNFLARALGGAKNRRTDIYQFNADGLLRLHHPNGDNKIEHAYPWTWFYLYSLASRKLEVNWHDVGVDDILLAFEIWALENGVEFEDSASILKGRPLSLSSNISWDFKKGKQTYDGALEPDGLFRLGDHYFALEFDRDTESIYASTFKHTKSWLRTFLQYGNVFENKTYQKEWGIKTLMLLVVSTSPNHLQNIITFMRDDLEQTGRGICFKALPELSDTVKCPTPDLPLFDEWQRVGHETFHLGKEVKNGHSTNTKIAGREGRDRPSNNGSGKRRKKGTKAR